MEEGGALPLFQTAMAAKPGGTDSALESDPLVSGKVEQGVAALVATERRQIAGGRDDTPAGKVGTIRIRPSAAPALPAVGTSTSNNEGGREPAAKGRRYRSRGSGRG